MGADPAEALALGATALGHLALAALAGGVAMPWAWPSSRLTGRRRPGAWADRADARARRLTVAGVVALVVAQLAGLWAQAATMGDVPLSRAGPEVWPVLVGTHAGGTWLLVGAGLAAIAMSLVPRLGAAAEPHRRAMRQELLASGLLGVFAARVAAGHGGASTSPLDLPIHAVHLVAGGLWVGVVLVGVVVLRPGPHAMNAEDRLAIRDHVDRLSTMATVALASIVLTGLAAMARVAPPAAWGDAAGTPYVTALAVKVALVAVAAALGAHNRWRGLPALRRALSADADADTATPATTATMASDTGTRIPGRANKGDGKDAATAALARFHRVLTIEAVVLVAVAVVAARLVTSAPPVG